jgi:hypothetical protein
MWNRADGWPGIDETHTLVESYEAGWAWSVPITKTMRCIAFMVDPALTKMRGRAELTEQYRRELDRTVRLHRLVQTAELVDTPWACEASPYDASRTAVDGVLLVGDAASFVDPLSSFGVKKALASAWLAAVVTHTALTQPEMAGPASNLYEARERAMFETLQRQSADLSRSAATEHEHPFWLERADADVLESNPLDVSALRRDRPILEAFETLKSRSTVRFRAGDRVQRSELPVVVGNRIALATHLVIPDFTEGIRFVRDVDLVKLAELAPSYSDVGELYESYQREVAAAQLPDFLGALSLLIAKHVLEYA